MIYMYKNNKNYENLQRMIFDGIGEYDIPEIQPTSYKGSEFIPFNYAKYGKKKNPHVHIGYEHNEFGDRDANQKEKDLIEKIKKKWYNYRNK